MSSSLKQKIQFKLITAFCSWVERELEGKTAEEVIDFGHFIGRLAMMFPVKGKREILPSLKKLLPERNDHEEIYKKIFIEQTGRLLPDALLAFKKGSKENFPYKVKYENYDYLDELIKRGKGVIITTGHFGNWEVFLQAMVWRGVATSVVQRQHHNEKINEFITNKREMNGAQAINFHRRRPESFRQCLEALKQGRVLGVLVDVVPKTRTVDVNFMGKKFAAPMGPALMAQMTGAAIVPGYNVREGDVYRCVMCEELVWPNEKPSRDDISAMTVKIMASLEAAIRQHPDNWIWYLRRWRELPFDVELGS